MPTVKHSFVMEVKQCSIVITSSMSETKAMLETIGERIKKSIEDAGLTQAVVAQECGVTKQAITGWIKNNSISKKNLLILHKITGADYEWLLTGKKQNGVKEESAHYSTVDKEMLERIHQLKPADRARLSAIIDALNPKLDRKTGE